MHECPPKRSSCNVFGVMVLTELINGAQVLGFELL